MLQLQLKNCHLIFRFYPLPFPVASQSSARAVSTHALSERMKEMSERIEAMDQITQNMDREFKSSRVVSTRLIYQQNGNVSWRRRAQIKQLAWPIAEWQMGHWKSSLVLCARSLRHCWFLGSLLRTFRSVICVVSGSRSIFRAAKTENPFPRSFFAPKPHGNACCAG